MGTLLRVDFAPGVVVPIALLEPDDGLEGALALIGEGDDPCWARCFGGARVYPGLRLVVGGARRWLAAPPEPAPPGGVGAMEPPDGRFVPPAEEPLAWMGEPGVMALRALVRAPAKVGVIDEGFDPALLATLGASTLARIDGQGTIRPLSWARASEAPGRHGTMMASVIAARRGVVSGVAPAAPLALVQLWEDVGGCPHCDHALSLVRAISGWRELLGVLSAMEHLLQQGCRVIVMSRAWPDWGRAGRLIIDHVTDALLTQDVVPVLAVGNTGVLERSLVAGLDGPLVVGARDARGVASTSNLAGFNLLAPGMGVPSLEPGGGVVWASGSSVAAAVVAGVVALLRGAAPGTTAREVVTALKDSSWGIGCRVSQSVGPELLLALKQVPWEG